jgi:glycosyltransferase involved in cell wall biosynthesis
VNTVLHIVPSAFGPRGIFGGAERYAFELARAMAGFVPTTLLTFGERHERWREGELDVVVERAAYIRGQRTNPWTPALLGWVRRARVVHCHQRHVLASSTAALLGRLLRRPVFVSDLGGGGWDISAYIDTSRWFSGHLHISQYSRNLSARENVARAHVIMGGVDTEKFSPDPAVPRDGKVLFVGRLLPHKGVNYLVEAADDRMRLHIVGTPGDARFKADLDKLARGKRVEFVSEASDQDLVRAYRSASVAVLPSVYRTLYGDTTLVPELLGQAALEAMACGTPVVVTSVASLPEVVADGKTGFVVPPNDPAALREKLAWLLEHPDDAARMGAAGRRRVLEHFSWPAVVRRCLELYQT